MACLAEGEPGFVHLARLLPCGTRPRRALRSMRAPRADPSSRTARRRSFDVTPLTGPPVTLANGDWADLATGVTAYTRPSWRRIWTSPSREASSSTSARRWRAVEYVYSFIDPAPPMTSLASSRSSGSGRPARATETQMILASRTRYAQGLQDSGGTSRHGHATIPKLGRGALGCSGRARQGGSCHGCEGSPPRTCRWQARTFRVRSTQRHNPTQDTLHRLLRPSTLAPLEPCELHSSVPR